MISFLLAAALLQSSTADPIPSLCGNRPNCTPPAPTVETQAGIVARREKFMALDAQVYAPIRYGRNAANCASAIQLAKNAQRPDMVAAITALCAA